VPRPNPASRDVSGLLLLDKPRGLSSNRALQRVKRIYSAAKAGHTGSLDPLATGMLPICFGFATRLSGYLLDSVKSYHVTAELGVATDSGDADGQVIGRIEQPIPGADAVRAALRRFEGEIEQVPPMHSALKQRGVRLYELARRGVEVPREARRVSIEAIALEHYEWPELRFTVRCSKGTYVRSLVVDLAAALGTLGHVRELRRLAVGPFGADGMTTLDTLEALEPQGAAALDGILLPPDTMLAGLARIDVEDEAAARLAQGQAVPASSDVALGLKRVYDRAGRFVAIAEATADRTLLPRRVFLR
jgi:tRNA pseudouridine55 synthase